MTEAQSVQAGVISLVRPWVLQLNDMRHAHIENLVPVCQASTREELEAFVVSQRVEPYRDGQWGKSFRKGGPLEWFNQPWEHSSDHFVQAPEFRFVAGCLVFRFERIDLPTVADLGCER